MFPNTGTSTFKSFDKTLVNLSERYIMIILMIKDVRRKFETSAYFKFCKKSLTCFVAVVYSRYAMFIFMMTTYAPIIGCHFSRL